MSAIHFKKIVFHDELIFLNVPVICVSFILLIPSMKNNSISIAFHVSKYFAENEMNIVVTTKMEKWNKFSKYDF